MQEAHVSSPPGEKFDGSMKDINRCSIRSTTEFLDSVLDLNGIARYHACNLNRTQSVAEHSFNVAMIAWETALWLWSVEGDQGHVPYPYQVLVGALLHDIEEVFVGDIPGPVKHEYPEFKSKVEDVVAKVKAEWSDSLPEYVLRDTHRCDLRTQPPLARQIVKMADCLEFTMFCLEDYLKGNRMAGPLVMKGLFLCRTAERDTLLRREDCPLERLRSRLSEIADREVT